MFPPANNQEATAGPERPVRVFIYYTGVGIIRRGVESFTRECFDNLHGLPGLSIELYKGAGPDGPDERRLWCISRLNPWAAFVGRMTGHTGCIVEELSGFLSLISHIRARRPDVIYIPGGKLNMLLCQKARRWVGVPYRVLFSNGAPDAPPFPHADHVHQINPTLLEEAIRAGTPREKQSLVPYGIRVPSGSPANRSPAALAALRTQLGLPTNRQIVLSVGWISRAHKRMDYTIEEVARIPEAERPYLLLLGHQDEASPSVIQLANERLGAANFTVRSAVYEAVNNYYQAADVFTLASLGEAFGRVYLEALVAGLPCVVHDHPIQRFVLGDEGTFVDMTQPGSLASELTAVLRDLTVMLSEEKRARRRHGVRLRFGWEALAGDYLAMFIKASKEDPHLLIQEPVQ